MNSDGGGRLRPVWYWLILIMIWLISTWWVSGRVRSSSIKSESRDAAERLRSNISEGFNSEAGCRGRTQRLRWIILMLKLIGVMESSVSRVEDRIPPGADSCCSSVLHTQFPLFLMFFWLYPVEFMLAPTTCFAFEKMVHAPQSAYSVFYNQKCCACGNLHFWDEVRPLWFFASES